MHPAPDLVALLTRYERPLVRYAQQITGDLEAARDVVQETFIAWVRLREAAEAPPENRLRSASVENAEKVPHRPADASHLEAWLFTVTRHRALDHQRKFRRIIPMDFPDERPCAAPGPSATLEQRDDADSLLRLLEMLPPNQREVIRLKFQNDLSYREISEVTQLSVTNVGFLLHTGLKKLRAILLERATDDFGLHLRHTL